ncbi:uncharacterized protein ACNLHF_008956 isoform 1-T3 [Anomaloglossus baeobatrachus]|uniref:uncharacterized protein LOC142290793 n=1 Tax=Anomaloglossus baeobatrachus TaxID=238106 RepID=UPI003F5098F5
MEEWDCQWGLEDLYNKVRMGNDPQSMDTAARLLTLALEMIEVITGEEHTVVRKTTGERVLWSTSRGPISSPPHSPIYEKKILELTDKIIELLTGEVPLRCQDIAVYFSMEEWDYVGRQKNQYKNVLKETCEPPLPRNGARRRNPLDRCPSPLSSRSSPQENVRESHHADDLIDIKVEVLDEEEEADVMAEQQYGLGVINRLERCPAPPYSQDYADRLQGEDLTDIKVEDEEEQTMADQLCMSDMNEKNPEEQTTGKTSNNSEEEVVLPPNYKVEEGNTMQHSSAENLIALNVHPGFDTTDFSYKHDAPSSDQSQIVTSSTILNGGKLFQLDECEKSQFTQSSGLLTNKRSLTGKKTYKCLECGRCFPQKSNLVTHGRTHTGEKPFPCSECGKYFTHKSSLVVHKNIHTGERPFSCSECKKCFTHKSSLIKHERSHRGEKPFTCLLCGKCFTRRSGLNQHEKRHKGEKPYSCSECGKCFTDKSNFVTHQRIHTGEKPFICSECGKRFTNKAHLVLHERSHTGEKPYSCSECGKCYKDKSRLVKHERTHTGEKPFSCSECESCFTDKSGLVRHQRTHTGEAF